MVVRATAINTDRVERIKLGEYDQVFALTQKLINDGLYNKFGSLDKKSPLRGEIDTGEGQINGRLKGKVGAPQVVVNATFDKNLSGVDYMICFDSGKCLVKWEEANPAASPDDLDSSTLRKDTVDIGGWAVAFHVMLGMVQVERESDKFEQTVGKSLPGNYSLNALVARFETAEYNEAGSVFGKDWERLPQAGRRSFRTLIENTKTQVLSLFEQTGTIGFALKSADEVVTQPKPMLTFEPCDIQYQTYPWVDDKIPSYTPTIGMTGNSELNYLLYAEVTKDASGRARELPAWNQRFLDKHMGNWTDGRLELSAQNDPSGYGAFYMSGKNFFNDYLLQKLKVLNSTLDTTIGDVSIRIVGSQYPTTYYTLDLRHGDLRGRSETDAYYDFKPVPGKRNEWKYSSSTGVKKDEAYVSILGGNTACSIEAQAFTENTVSFEPGRDVINVQGSTRFKCLVKTRDKLALVSAYEVNIEKDIEVTWSMELDLESVSDGGLHIKTTLKGPDCYAHKNETFMGGVFLYALPEYFMTSVNRAINNAKNISADLARDLEGKQALCLPAQGVFYFKDPILSANGDLVCSIGYMDGVSPEDMLNPHNDVIVNEEASKAGRVREKPVDQKLRTPLKGLVNQKITHEVINKVLSQHQGKEGRPIISDEPGPIDLGEKGLSVFDADDYNWDMYSL